MMRLLLLLVLFLVPIASAAVFTNLASQPTTLPAGTISGVAYSDDGSMMAVASSIGRYVYSVSGSGISATYTNITTAFSAGNKNAVKFSHSGSYLCVADTSAQRLHIIDTSSWTDNGRPPFVNDSASDCAWSPDENFFAVSTVSGNTSALMVYYTGGSIGTPSSYLRMNLSTTTTSAHSLDWTGGDSLVVGVSGTPFFRLYEFNDTAQNNPRNFVNIPNPAILPANSIGAVKVNSAGTEIAMASFAGGSGTDFITYTYSPGFAGTGTVTKHGSLSGCAANSAGGVAWVNDPILSYVTLTCTTSGYRLYSYDGTTFTQITGANGYNTGPFGSMSMLNAYYSGNTKNIVIGTSNRTMIYALGVADAPTNVTVISNPRTQGDGACQTINWTAPTTGPAPTGYSLFYTISGSHPTDSPMNRSLYSYRTHVNGLSHQACLLTSSQRHDWRVVSTTSDGEGLPSANAFNTTVAGQPVLLNNTYAGGVLNLSWHLGPGGNQGMTGFSIFYNITNSTGQAYPMNSTSWHYYSHVDSPTLNTTVLGLTVNTTYCFRVQSTNASAWGEGDISNSTTCRLVTSGTTPFAPVLSGSRTSLTLGQITWTTPAGTILGYNVTRLGAGGPNTYHFDSSVNSMNVALFESNSTFSVHAWNSAGNSAESNVVTLQAANTTLFDETDPGSGTFWGNDSAGSIAMFGTNEPTVYRWFLGFCLLVIMSFGGLVVGAKYLSANVAELVAAMLSVVSVALNVAFHLWQFWNAIFLGLFAFAMFMMLGAVRQSSNTKGGP